MNKGFGRLQKVGNSVRGPRMAAMAVCALALAATHSAAQAPVVLPATISTLAGNGSNGSSGNGGPATAAELSTDIRDVAVDGQGNVFIVDTSNNEVRKINAASGAISIVAGGGTLCAAAIDEQGDNCLAATQTVLKTPRGIALDAAGNIYIAGYDDYMVHKVNIQTGLMTVLAGAPSGKSNSGNTKGYSGDGGAANVAALNEPRGVAVDAAGNVWIADTGNNVIREVSAATGDINTVVGYNTGTANHGTATAGYGGDGSAANSSSVELNEPIGMAFDGAGNLYIADFNNKVIRKVAASGGVVSGSSIISTIAGEYGASALSTAPAFPAPATSTPLGSPAEVAVDSSGNVYIADSGEDVVYLYDPTAQTIAPVAGQWGFSSTTAGYAVCGAATDSLGDGCAATQSVLNSGSSVLGVALDALNNLYITDPGDARIREASSNLVFAASAAGTGTTQNIEVHFAANDTPAASGGIALGGGAGDFSLGAPACTVASDNTDNCTAALTFNALYPGLRAAALNIASAKSLFAAYPLSGTGTAALQSIDPGTVSTLGSGLAAPQGAALDAAGNLYLADTGNNRVVEISATTQAQTVIAGTGTSGYSGDGGAAASARLNAPAAVAVGPRGTVYIADTGNNAIRAVNPRTGLISTYAGGGTVCAFSVDSQGDGCPAMEATLVAPAGVAVGAGGDLYISDTGDNAIRRVDAATGAINLDAGTAPAATCGSPADRYGDGCPLVSASTVFSSPAGLAVDGSGNIFVADTGDNLVRELSPATGLVSVVAGNGQSTFTGDGGAATSASLNGPTAVAVDAAEDLYIADTGNAAVRVVSGSTGTISTLLGQGGVPGSSGGSGAVSELLLTTPHGASANAAGNLYVVDTGNSRAIEDNRNSALLAFGRGNLNASSPEQTATVSDLGNVSLTFAGSPVYAITGDTSDFVLDTSAATACPAAGTVSPGAGCTLAAAFDPIAQNALSVTLTFASNAVNQGTAGLEMTGTGVQLAATQLSLTQTTPAGSLTYGQQATFTAAVAPATGSGTPTGTIVFSVDGTLQPAITLTATDQAVLTLTLPVGTHTIGASYSGDDTYAPSNASLQVPVSQAATTATLTIAPTTQIQLQPVTFTSQVTSSTTGIPTGSVNFMAAGKVLGSGALDAQGKATLTTSSLAIASYSVTAVYSGDPNYAASTSGAVQLTINPIPPGIVVSASPTALSVPQGGQVQTTLVVTPQGGLSGTVTLGCSGLPANSNCTFYPTTLNLGGTPTGVPSCTVPANSPAGTACTLLTVTTNLPPAAAQARAGQTGRGAPMVLAVFFPALAFAFGPIFARKRRKISWLAVMGVLALASLTVLSGCTNNVTQQVGQPTPLGTSTVTVTLTGANSVKQTLALILTVVTPTPVTAEAEPLQRLLANGLPAEAQALDAGLIGVRPLL